MIIGIGTDIVEVQRIKGAVEKGSFLKRYFTKKEQEMFKQCHDNPEKIAGNFAAKEALSKAYGTGLRGFSLCDIEVLRNEDGKPYIEVYGVAKEIKENLKIQKIHVSLSNTKEYATAFVICEKQ